MADKTFLLRLLTPYKSVFEDQVEAVIVPGELGEFGVLAQHTKFITSLIAGVLRYVSSGRTYKLAVSGGFAEVYPEGVTVLADALERPGDIDIERAKESRDRALEKLAKRSELDQTTIDRLEARMARARNRLALASAKGA